jgi:hypothetical protein
MAWSKAQLLSAFKVLTIQDRCGCTYLSLSLEATPGLSIPPPPQEMEVGGLQSEVVMAKKTENKNPKNPIRPYLKNKLKQKGLGAWLK